MAVATGTVVAVDPAGTVAVGPVGAVAVGAGDVAVGAGDVEVGGLVGVAESPAHAKATIATTAASNPIIGVILILSRNTITSSEETLRQSYHRAI